MEHRIRALLSFAVYLIVGSVLAASAGAQTLVPLHEFSVRGGIGVNHDGAVPKGPLVFSGGVIYGTTFNGGEGDNGVIFRMNPDGTGFTNLHSFAVFGYDPTTGNNTNYDGAYPEGLIVSGATLYGAADGGGPGGTGTIFKMNTDGSSFAVLHAFTPLDPDTSQNADGAYPAGILALGGGTLYGTALNGGMGGDGVGTVFALSTNGGAVTRLVDFSDGYPQSTNGYTPYALTLSGATLYGVTQYGGTSATVLKSGYGSVFKIGTNGGGFATLHSFNSLDGLDPETGVVVTGNMVYGVARGGGAANEGTVFAVTTNGGSFTNLHSFSALISTTNSDGAVPDGLIVANGNLYGTTGIGGPAGNGTIFQLTTNGGGFGALYNFTPTYNGTNSDGASPAAVVFSGNKLFGTAMEGGTSGAGTIFELILPATSPIPLNILSLSHAVVLSWTNPAFSLQAAPSLTNSFTTLSNATSPYTNSINAPQELFRLIAP